MAAAPLSLWKNMAKNPLDIFKNDELGLEIAHMAVPAALALTADPIASLVDTAFIGHIGPSELAAVGVSIAIINQASKVAIFPLVSVTTSFVAEEDAKSCPEGEASEMGILETKPASEMDIVETKPESDDEMQELIHRNETRSNRCKKRHISSASSALVIASALGLFQAVILIVLAKPLLSYMGVDSNSPMLEPASRYLTLRSLGAPAVLLSLAMQGVFRGFKDTKTPLYATMIGDVANVVLDPIFIFVFGLGVSGAAIAHVISQYLMSLILMWRLMQQISIVPASIEDLQLSRFLKCGFLLLFRVIAATFCQTLAASLAAKLGSMPMAAFQICLQLWLATSLLADGLAVAGQAILANAFAVKDYERVVATAARVLQLGVALGLVLCIVVAMILKFSSQLFTDDMDVLDVLQLGIPFVALTQPINSLAFVFDGLNFGASDFSYSAYSMVLIAGVTISCLIVLSSISGFIGIWCALSIFMSLRAAAGFIRIGTKTGPWKFLRG